jgi:hypothetical protein
MKMDTSNAQKAHKLMPQWYKISLIKISDGAGGI